MKTGSNACGENAEEQKQVKRKHVNPRLNESIKTQAAASKN